MYFGLSNKNSLHYLKFGIPTSQFLGLPLRTTHPKGTPTFPLTTPMESDAEEEAAATPAAVAGPAAGRLKGSPELTVDADMQEMAKAAAWSVSSCKAGNGVAALRDDNLDTYWQSDGAQPHLVNIQFQKKVQLQLVVLYVDFKLDESYTPSKISIRAGDGFHNLKRNIHSYIYAPNCDFVQSPKRAGHSYPTDQDLWAKTGVHHILHH
ncbi:anaphase-promoting complex subunit 10-like isoform X4 [Panicum virgatum]|uniref:anaphase-promoting complex subunit 10-like isoform X4 n=1 Tax=Panicum virgatum TaxID=38727 RepID=UPI0019D61118|nr:anaphase-promoting complex subunit 10-like isoform X4 [Panicum virgatum]